MPLKTAKIFVITEFWANCPLCSWSNHVAAWVNSSEKVVCERCLGEFMVSFSKEVLQR